MGSPASDADRPPRRGAAVWIVLAALSLALAALLDLAGLAAALLLGAMIAGVVVATRGARLTVPAPLFVAAQALVGCLIASSIDVRIGARLLADWPVFLAITLATVAASSALGYALSRWRVVPGTVAIWGSSPGAATAMVIMAQAYGADVRLVAVMIYTRVVAVAATASLLSLALGGHGGHRSAWAGLLAVDPKQFTLTLAIGSAGALAGRVARIPAGALIGPMILGILLSVTGVVRVAPPHALLACAYLVVGWRIGLGFTREAVRAAMRALPRIIASALLLIGFCAGLATILVVTQGIDPVTAYLATSPGGMDSVAIIASAGRADVSFVMALQLVRFAVVMLVGPTLATTLARRQRRGEADEQAPG